MLCDIDENITHKLCQYLENNDINNFIYYIKIYLKDLSNTCVEDIAREFLNFKNINNCIKILEKQLNLIMKEDLEILKIIFMIIFTYYRRFKQIEEMKKILKKFEKKISKSAIFFHALAMIKEKDPLNYDSIQQRLIQPIKLEERALQLDKNYFYAKHKYCDLVAKLLEYNIQISNKCEYLNKKCIPTKYIQKALSYLEEITTEKPEYARAYYTLAQIYMMLGKYDEAEKNIMKAIDNENPNEIDYTIRIMDYTILRQNIRILRRIEKVFKNENIKIKNELKTILKNTENIVKDYSNIIEQRFAFLVAIMSILLTFVFTSNKIIPNTKVLIINIILMYLAIFILLFLNYYIINYKGKGKNRYYNRKFKLKWKFLAISTSRGWRLNGLMLIALSTILYNLILYPFFA